jgi:alpha-mannosidase
MRKIFLTALVLVMAWVITAYPQPATTVSVQPKRQLGVVGNAHLDTQWRWTIQNTINEWVPNTFRDNFKLFETFPDYVFSFEGAFRYMLIKEYYSAEYERLKSYIAKGRWRVTGSWVDAADVNVPSFESLVRQSLYGNGYYRQEFGKTSRDVFLPDCFGFGYALPSIAAHCGIKSFSTQKLSWGSSVGVPFGIGLWEGVDGSALVAGLKPGDYVAKIQGDLSRDTTWLKRIDQQGDSSGLYAAYMYFGTGDTGGSPDSASVDWLAKSIKSDGPISVKSIGADDLVELASTVDKAKLPHYKGELLMTRHGVGCYTSQAAMKRWNRKNELLADATERASVLAHLYTGLEYPRQTLKETWIRFLWHQFHDDITGTSIPEAYEFSWNDEIVSQNRFSQMLLNAVEATTPALDTRVKGVPLVVFNPLAIDREDAVEATLFFDGGAPDGVTVIDAANKATPTQVIDRKGDSLKIVFLADVPSVGYAAFDVRPAAKAGGAGSALKIDTNGLENERYRIRVDQNGDVASILDKLAGRELLAGPIQWQLLFDKPKQWPAWEIGYDDVMAKPAALLGAPAEITVAENGPARVSLQVLHKTAKSQFRTIIRLSSGAAGDRIEFDCSVDWYERETLLKVAFPLAAANDSVTYDLGLGSIKRGLNKKELYEVPGHQWADMASKNNDYGVAVLNDCKYGWDHPEAGVLRLTLIHTPGVFDSWDWVGDERSQDNGYHQFKFALYGHKRELGADVPWQAARLNQPLMAFQTTAHKGTLGKKVSLLAVNTSEPQADKAGTMMTYPGIFVNAVKLAETGEKVVIRLKELIGKPVENARVRFAMPALSACEVNGLEDSIGSARIVAGELLVSLKPYQPKAFAVRLDKGKAVATRAPECRPLALPYDLDGISDDNNRRDGDFDGQGNALVGELIPDTLICDQIPFVFGPKASGALNVVKCNGQVLTLPDGVNDRLYLVATAVGGPGEGTFAIDGKPHHLWVQDYAEHLAQWNSRLISGKLLEEPEQIAPAYINRQPVAWYGTHRHNVRGENDAYKFTYLYLIRIDLPADAKSVTLPTNPRIRLLAATAANTGYDDVRAAEPLYDYANAALARIVADSSNFVGQATVTMTTATPGASIRYTLDGSKPDASSPEYKAPITLAKSTTVKARAILAGSNDSYVTTASFSQLVLREPVKTGELIPGLQCSYYEGAWTKLPPFDSLKAIKTVVVDSVTLPNFARSEDFGLMMTGYVQVPKDGMYEFTISSDDGSRLYVADTLLIDNDGLHGAGDVIEQIALKAGLHPIKILMFQSKGGRALDASLRGPGTPRQSLSSGVIFHEAARKQK